MGPDDDRRRGVGARETRACLLNELDEEGGLGL